MKTNLLYVISVIFFTMILSVSCVSSKKYEEALSKQANAEKKNDKLAKDNHDLNVKLTEVGSLGDRLNTQLQTSKSELDEAKQNAQRTSQDLMSLQKNYDEMNAKYLASLSGKNAENAQLSKDLQNTKVLLDKRQKELDEKEALILEKEKRVKELQDILDKKDQDLQTLKDKVTNALLGFQGKGLTVYTKNGKVYVSMDEKLLFSSASWSVSDEGKKALQELGFLLQKNPDINVLIEGHTDNVPLGRNGEVKDNWDLSVMRATSIVKALLENKAIDPTQITAAGRGEFSPIAPNDSKENRSKNRRSEIILTPNLDALFQILNN